jgi:hypothetical protein
MDEMPFEWKTLAVEPILARGAEVELGESEYFAVDGERAARSLVDLDRVPVVLNAGGAGDVIESERPELGLNRCCEVDFDGVGPAARRKAGHEVGADLAAGTEDQNPGRHRVVSRVRGDAPSFTLPDAVLVRRIKYIVIV